MIFEKVKASYDAKGRRELVPTGEPDQHFECDDVLVAIGQENSFPWIERDIGIEFDKWGMPVVDKVTMRSTHPKIFLRRRFRFRPEEHHLGGGARSRRGDLDRQDALGRGHERAARSAGEPHVPENGHPRVELRQSDLQRGALQGAVAGQESDAARHQGRSRARFRSEDRIRRSAALSQLRRADGVRARSSASNATRASTSARWTASRSPRTAKKRICARG